MVLWATCTIYTKPYTSPACVVGAGRSVVSVTGVIVIGVRLSLYLNALGVDIRMCHKPRRLSHLTNHPMSRHLKYTRQIHTSFLKIKTPALGRAFLIAVLNSFWSASSSSAT